MNRKQTLMAVLAVTIGFGFTHPAPVAGQTTQDDAATSYDVARRLLNSAQWMQAVEKFRLYREADTGARYAAESLYWEAYALSRMESTRYWRQALTALDMQMNQYPDASTAADTKALLAKVHGELANRGDSQSAEWIYRESEWTAQFESEQTAQFESEQDEGPDETKLMALNALMQMDSRMAMT